jgi:phosphonate dehydrogenase
MISGLPRVVVTHWVHPEVVAYLRQFSDPAVPDVGGVWTHAQLAGQVGDAEALIACMADRVDDAFLDQCPRLRIVAATLKGYDNFDAATCARRGVWLTIVPDTIIPPTAELAVGLTLGITRRVGAPAVTSWPSPGSCCPRSVPPGLRTPCSPTGPA